jgi:5-methyltetrahydrofolate--homocysteine methyltransferase
VSGLITPSLEEMQHVAAEMQKDPWFRERNVPLLIGGATTSRVHTAVKIAPKYDGPVIWVADASRSVGIAQSLIGENKAAFVAETHAEYEHVRELHAKKRKTPMWPLAQARANKTAIAWENYTPPKPKFFGVRHFKNIDLNEIVPFLDWTPYFQTWDLAGHFPDILSDAVVGVEATKVYDDAQAMLKKMIAGRWISANAAVGFWPANTVHDDDIEFYADEQRDQVVLTWYGLRQQTERPKDAKTGEQRPSRCLSDFIAPKDTGIADYGGAFACTAGIGAREKIAEFVKAGDDYSAIVFEALTDRLAEGTAEWLHHRVRTDLWGYMPGEKLTNEELIAEKYQGRRPAPGYPSCPDHRVKKPMFALLRCDKIGMECTDGYAMFPGASVSAFYFSHPASTYFRAGAIDMEQVKDMAARSGAPVDEVERALAPNLSL